MILLIDNYDSFSYNLYQLIGSINPDIRVVRNDKITLDEIEALNPSHIILSPGPGRPSQAGICEDVVRRFAGKIPILGVCLGHQAICEAFGATISYAKELMHGKKSDITLDLSTPIFFGLPHVIEGARYHSLSAVPETIPPCLKVIATAEDGEIMAVRHREYEVYGLQFHPESILTPKGHHILKQFLTGRNTTMIKEAITKIVDKQDLTYEEAYAVMSEIMSGETTPTQNAAFLAALSTKSTKAETIDEISGCAAAMRDKAIPVDTGDMKTLEIVGTGGDGAHSFNISTTTMFVLAAGGVKVAKHGNRAASSSCGAADCLEALGANIQQDPETCVRLLKDVGACFMFAQKYHTSMKYVGAIRKELGFRTVFNILGPITNPAHPEMELLGVYDEYLVEPLAHVLTSLGTTRGLVVHGLDKLDEVSICGPTKICEFDNGKYQTYTIQPEDFGLTRGTKADLLGGTPAENAQITTDILSGKLTGPKRDAVLMNAAAGLYIDHKVDTLAEGVERAKELIDSGAALATMKAFIAQSPNA
ncbi:MAG: bifunctional anthranilate synthase component II/anthranilate phosphoribosyltransferase [Clostridiales bacterium]|nr:bifunctional anthranilate synthase component II/anthranilate phosphoribosyltransferase [Clostridiales bacterium]